MNDIALIRNETTDLERWLVNAGNTHKIAVGLAKSSFVPKSMAGRPEDITAAILAGQEIGLEPMAALRSIDIIDGTPALRAVTLRALVQSRGHKIWVKESGPTKAVVCGQRAGELDVQTSTWTIDRAKTAGLASKKNWQNHPSAMLVARATSEVARLIAADAILGLPYTVEEIQDGVIYDVSTGEATPTGPTHVQTPKMSTMRRRAWQRTDADQGVPEPPIDEPTPTYPPEPEPLALTSKEDGAEWPEVTPPADAA